MLVATSGGFGDDSEGRLCEHPRSVAGITCSRFVDIFVSSGTGAGYSDLPHCPPLAAHATAMIHQTIELIL